MVVETIHLIRHGETEFSSRGRLQGVLPVALNGLGREQAHALGKYLRGLSIDAINTSLVTCALQTATIINTYLQLPLEKDVRLREIEFGIFEGFTYDGAK